MSDEREQRELEREGLALAAEAGIHRLAIPTPFQVGRVNAYLIEDSPLTLVDSGPNSAKALDELEQALIRAQIEPAVQAAVLAGDRRRLVRRGTLLLVALDRHADAAGRVRLGRIATLPIRNPVILGSALCIAASAAGVRAPSVAATPPTWLSAAAVPAALVALGASAARPLGPSGLPRPATRPPAGHAARPRPPGPDQRR